jgi:hypothetical protein
VHGRLVLVLLLLALLLLAALPCLISSACSAAWVSLLGWVPWLLAALTSRLRL